MEEQVVGSPRDPRRRAPRNPRFRALRHAPVTDETVGLRQVYDDARHVLTQVRMRERHIRYTIAALVLIYGVLGTIALLTPGGTQGSPTRSLIVGILVATTLPMALAVTRVNLGPIWWTKKSSLRGFNTIFVLYADLGLTLCLVAFDDARFRLYGAALFSVVGGYVAHFVRARVVYAHMLFSSVVVCVLCVVAWLDGVPTSEAVFILIVLLVATNGTTALHRSYTADFQQSLKRQLVMANTDALTGLLNRRGFLYATSTSLRRGPAGPFTLVAVDVDRFKAINDEYGHTIGDAVLQRVATILQGSVDDDALVARLGGDEFAIALRHDEAVARELAEHVLAQPIEIATDRNATVTLGVAVGSVPGGPLSDETAAALIRRDFTLADAALFEAKAAGRGGYTVVHAPVHEDPVHEEPENENPVDLDGGPSDAARSAGPGARRGLFTAGRRGSAARRGRARA